MVSASESSVCKRSGSDRYCAFRVLLLLSLLLANEVAEAGVGVDDGAAADEDVGIVVDNVGAVDGNITVDAVDANDAAAAGFVL